MFCPILQVEFEELRSKKGVEIEAWRCMTTSLEGGLGAGTTGLPKLGRTDPYPYPCTGKPVTRAEPADPC